jgi:hypothetical protein
VAGNCDCYDFSRNTNGLAFYGNVLSRGKLGFAKTGRKLKATTRCGQYKWPLSDKSEFTRKQGQGRAL